MYNNTIKVENKIISSEELSNIFGRMYEVLTKYLKIYEQEYARNQMLDYSQKTWTFKDYSSKLTFQVDFYDNTNIKFDNYINFISIYNSRLHEIKSINVWFRLSYSVQQPGIPYESFSEYINLYVREKKMDVDVSLNSSNGKMDEIYKLIENMVLNAPEKYDYVIKKKSKISNVIGFALGAIPATIITTLLLLYEPARNIASSTFVAWPIVTLLFSFGIGNLLMSNKIGDYYKKIMPEQKYAGYDYSNNRRIYEDDIDEYVGTSEILIGKNIDNLDARKRIMETYEKYKKWPLYEILVIAVISIIVLFL